MNITLIPYDPAAHAKPLSNICYEAFAEFEIKHGFPPDFPSADAAEGMFGLLGDPKTVYGVVAVADGKVVGSNFLWTHGPVAGVGPITVDPSCQASGVGRKLMRAVLDEAARRGIPRVRLVQDAHNQRSLSLYASLGFNQQHCLSLVQAVPFEADVTGCRPMTPGDLPAVERLSTGGYLTSRRNEVAAFLTAGLPGFVRERADGQVTAYLLPGMIGHGVASNDADLLSLVSLAARTLPPEFARCFCPLDAHDLFRALLAGKCQSIKTMNLMTVGPYERPVGSWMPSILY